MSTYDSLIAKLIVYDDNREMAIKKLRGVLGEFIIEGVETNVDFLFSIVNHEKYKNGDVDTGFVERFLDSLRMEKIC